MLIYLLAILMCAKTINCYAKRKIKLEDTRQRTNKIKRLANLLNDIGEDI